MCRIKIVFALGVLLAAAYARPEGYGVKGVKSFPTTANAAASAHAFANTGYGSSRVAQSFATASVGGTANAAAEATANAVANGENIGKAISSASAIANANYPIGRSEVLGREKDTEYKAGNHQAGTPARDQPILNHGHGGFTNKEHPTPGSISLTDSGTMCHPGDSICRNSKINLNVPSSTSNGNLDSSPGPSQILPDRNGGWGGNTANPGSRPCTYGSPKCSTNHIPNPDQTYPELVELPADQEISAYEQSLLKPQLTNEGSPHLSGVSTQPTPDTNSGWGSNTAHSDHRPCAHGSPKCAGSKPGISSPGQSNHKHAELPVDMERLENKQSVSNPNPSHDEHPDSSDGSSQPWPTTNGHWGGNPGNSGSRPCTCESKKNPRGQPIVPDPDQRHDERNKLTTGPGKPVTKQSVPDPYSTYNKDHYSSTSPSQLSPTPDGGSDSNTGNPEPRPCAYGSPKCSAGQLDVPHPNQPHDKHVELMTDLEKPATKPSVLNPQPSYNLHPDLSVNPSQPLPNLDGSYGGRMPIRPTGERDDVHGNHHDIPFNGNPGASTTSSYPSPNFGSGCGGNPATPGLRPCSSGSSGNKSGTSNPFLNGEIDVSEIRKAVKSDGSSPESSGTNSNPLNPFLNPNSQLPSLPVGGTHYSGSPNFDDEAEPSTQYAGGKLNPSNPFLNGHNQHLPLPTGSTHHSGKPNNSDQGPSDQNTKSKPNSFNPFLNIQGPHAPTLTGYTHDSENPNNSIHSPTSDQYPGSKHNSSSSFSSVHNQNPSTSGTHHLVNKNGNNEAGTSNQYPRSQQNPSNPIPGHRESDELEECPHGSCKHKRPNAGSDNENSDADKVKNTQTQSRPSDGVKTYRPGIKGHSAPRQETLSPSKHHVSGHENEPSADSNGSWDAYSKAHAIASASAGGNGSAYAKSQAYSSAHASSVSNSWSSSSASASASASSSNWR